MVIDAAGGANFHMPAHERVSIWLALDSEINKGPTTSFANTGAADSASDHSAAAVASFVVNDDIPHMLWLFSASTHADVEGNNGWVSLKLL